jgi:putative oxidoreductase
MSDIPAQESNTVDGAPRVAGLPSPSLHRFALNTWRIVLGFTFFTHGGQKLFGWFGGTAVGDRISLVGAAGILEFFGGLAIVLGIRTRFVAFVLCGEMAVAYWYRHALSRGPWHWENGGELAAVYCMTFLLMSVVGGGDLSIDGFLKRRSDS